MTNRNHKNNLFLCITTRHLCNIWRPPRDIGASYFSIRFYIIFFLLLCVSLPPHQNRNFLLRSLPVCIKMNNMKFLIRYEYYSRRESWYIKEDFGESQKKIILQVCRFWWLSYNARRCWWGGLLECIVCRLTAKRTPRLEMLFELSQI